MAIFVSWCSIVLAFCVMIIAACSRSRELESSGADDVPEAIRTLGITQLLYLCDAVFLQLEPRFFLDSETKLSFHVLEPESLS